MPRGRTPTKGRAFRRGVAGRQREGQALSGVRAALCQAENVASTSRNVTRARSETDPKTTPEGLRDDNRATATVQHLVEVDLDLIDANPWQPRHDHGRRGWPGWTCRTKSSPWGACSKSRWPGNRCRTATSSPSATAGSRPCAASGPEGNGGQHRHPQD